MMRSGGSDLRASRQTEFADMQQEAPYLLLKQDDDGYRSDSDYLAYDCGSQFHVQGIHYNPDEKYDENAEKDAHGGCSTDKFEYLVYQQSNSVQAIGSGQLYGKVLSGEADVLGSSYVPVVESDFIFSAVGEAFGFFGSCVVIGLLALITIQCMVVAKNASDYLGMLIATGISSMFMIQLFVNVGVATQILPNTGTPFPFLSSGLSSLLSGMLSVGVILNIKLQSKKRGGNSI